MEVFDLLVLGGGPGGYLCAERAAQKAQSVISTNAASNAEVAMAEAKLTRALVRKAVATYKP